MLASGTCLLVGLALKDWRKEGSWRVPCSHPSKTPAFRLPFVSHPISVLPSWAPLGKHLPTVWMRDCRLWGFSGPNAQRRPLPAHSLALSVYPQDLGEALAQGRCDPARGVGVEESNRKVPEEKPDSLSSPCPLLVLRTHTHSSASPPLKCRPLCNFQLLSAEASGRQ